MHKPVHTLLALALVAALSACGGSGSDAGAPNAPDVPSIEVPQVGDLVPDAGTLVLTAPDATYAGGGLHKSAYDALNTARLAAGAGLLTQSAAIDVAAEAHAKYLTTNIGFGLSHDQDSAKLDFYEATAAKRISKAGFEFDFALEVVGATGPSHLGSDCVLGLLNTVYHGAAMLLSSTHVGIGFGQDSLGTPLCVVDMAAATKKPVGQLPGSGELVAYPYAGQTDVFATFYADSEVPRPPVAALPSNAVGTPVIVSVNNADMANFAAAGTLQATVAQFVLKDAAGNLVPAAILANPVLAAGAGVTLFADDNLPRGVATLVPLAPLVSGQTYTVEFSATLKAGAPTVSKTWSFTTK